MLWETSFGKSAPELAGPNGRMPTLHPASSEKETQTSEYFSKSPVTVLVEDMFIQEIMKSAQNCLKEVSPQGFSSCYKREAKKEFLFAACTLNFMLYL